MLVDAGGGATVLKRGVREPLYWTGTYIAGQTVVWAEGGAVTFYGIRGGRRVTVPVAP